ncbi:MAG: Hsp20 family protein [Alphaproteobacteria bacterium]
MYLTTLTPRLLAGDTLFGDTFFNDLLAAHGAAHGRFFAPPTACEFRALMAPRATPRYDLTQVGEGEYDVTLAVPGFKDEEIEISQTDTQLVISGTHSSEAHGSETDTPPKGAPKGADNAEIQSEVLPEVQYIHRGIDARAFRHSFRLPADTHVREATLENGILRLRLQQAEAAKPRRIEINSPEITS